MASEPPSDKPPSPMIRPPLPRTILLAPTRKQARHAPSSRRSPLQAGKPAAPSAVVMTKMKTKTARRITKSMRMTTRTLSSSRQGSRRCARDRLPLVSPVPENYKKVLALVGLGVLVETLFNVIMPLSLKFLIDDALGEEDFEALVRILSVLAVAGIITSIVAIWYEKWDANLASSRDFGRPACGCSSISRTCRRPISGAPSAARSCRAFPSTCPRSKAR